MSVILRLLIACCCMGAAGLAAAQTERRVALVIGNAAYQHTRALLNPKNDAEALAKLLEGKGFAVTFKSDLDYRSLREAVRAFGPTARGADVALVYYGGHGIEVGGQNYLVPVDAKLEREADLEYEAVTLASVLNATAGARRLKLVILDACRNNPLADKMQLPSGVTRSVTRGLARIEPDRGVLVAYAAKEGTVAHDGTGPHSPYMEALLKHLPTPGLDVRLTFGKVRDAVLSATHNAQEPFTYGSLPGDVVTLVPGLPLTKDQDMELAFWASVKDSKTPSVLRTYLERYPNGEFAPVARALIEHFDRQLKAEMAERDEAKKRQEEERIAAVVRRIEEERRAGEAALAEERKRAEEAKNAAEAKAVEEKQRAEWLAKTEELRKFTEEMRQTKEALAAAEKERLRAVKEAEDARKVAEEAIALKRETEKTGNTAKLAALPKLEAPPPGAPFDGVWLITRTGTGCNIPTNTFALVITSGDINTGRGKVSPAGAFKFQGQSRATGRPMHYTGTLSGRSGSGTFYTEGGRCSGTFTAQRK